MNRILKRALRSAARSADIKLGRRLMRDDNPISRHIRSRILLTRNRLASGRLKHEHKPLFDISQFNQTGFVVLRGLYSDDLIETIRHKATLALEEPSKRSESKRSEQNPYRYMLHEAGCEIPEVEKLITPEILETLSMYYRSYVNIISVSVWRNLSVDILNFNGTARYVYSSSWHTDRQMPCSLKLFYLIHDVTASHGPLHIIPRQPTEDIFGGGYSGRIEETERIEVEAAKYIWRLTEKAGTVLIANTTRCLHRASIPAPDLYRDILQVMLFPASAPVPIDWVRDPNRQGGMIQTPGK